VKSKHKLSMHMFSKFFVCFQWQWIDNAKHKHAELQL